MTKKRKKHRHIYVIVGSYDVPNGPGAINFVDRACKLCGKRKP